MTNFYRERFELICRGCARDLGDVHNPACEHNGIGEHMWVTGSQVVMRPVPQTERTDR